MKNSGFDFKTFAHKLRALVTQLEKRTRIAKIQEYLYRHVASISIPKQLHCLDFRLANKHSTNATARLQLPAPELVPYLVENSFFHFVLASDNVLAASVVAASLVRNSLRPEKVVASMDWLEVSKYRCLVSAQQHRQEIIQDLYRVQQDPTKGTVHSGMIRQVIGASKTDMEVSRVTVRAKQAVEAAGGTVRRVYYNKLGFKALLKPEWFDKKGRLLPKAARPPPKQRDKVDSIGRLPAPTKPIPFLPEEKSAATPLSAA